jgi:hypothetical protein
MGAFMELEWLEVPKGLLDTGIEERVIEACRFFEIGNDDIDVSQRIKGEHAGVEIRVLRILASLAQDWGIPTRITN